MQRIKACAIASCLAVLALTLAPNAAADEWDQRTILKVTAPVRIPGRILQPGEYVMKLAYHTLSNRDIVQIFNSNQTELLETIIAAPRARNIAAGASQFTFWEMPAGEPPALRTWYYPGSLVGREFTYPADVRDKIAQNNPGKIPAIAEETGNLETATMGTVTSYGEFRPSGQEVNITTAAVQPPAAQPRTDEQAYAQPCPCPSAAPPPAQAQPRTDNQQYAPLAGCPSAARPTVSAHVLPPYPIEQAQPCPPAAQAPVTVQPQVVQPVEPQPAQPVEPQPAEPATVQPQVVQPVEPQPVQPVQPPEAQPSPYECPPAGAMQQGAAVQPRTDEAIQPQRAQPMTPEGCACPPATTTQPGVTAQPRTDEPDVDTDINTNGADLDIQESSSARFENNSDSNTAATPMANHRCC